MGEKMLFSGYRAMAQRKSWTSRSLCFMKTKQVNLTDDFVLPLLYYSSVLWLDWVLVS